MMSQEKNASAALQTGRGRSKASIDPPLTTVVDVRKGIRS